MEGTQVDKTEATLHHGDVKAALEDLTGVVSKYRADVDAKFDGVAVAADVDARLKKMEDDIFAKIDKSNDSLESLRRELAIDAIKSGEKPDYEELAAYMAKSSRKQVDASQFTPEWAEAYEKAVPKWLTEGAAALGPELQAAMSVGSGPDGGFAVFPTIERGILARMFDLSPMRRNATVKEVRSGFSFKSLYKTQRGSAGWRGETDTKAETTTPKIDLLELSLNEAYALPKATNWELMEGVAVFNVEQMLKDTASEDLAILEGEAFWAGNGVIQPRGITTYTHTDTASYDNEVDWKQVETVKTGNAGAFNATDPADILLDLIATLKPGYRAASAFYGSRATLAATMKLKGSTSGDYITLPRFDQKSGFNLTLLGFPFIEDEEVPAIATDSKSIYFGDMRKAYTIAQRRGMVVIRDQVTQKGYTLFDISTFVGGGMADFEALKGLVFSA